MDTNELLSQVIDNVVSEDSEAAAASFNQYATLKIKSLIESKKEISE